MCMIALKYSECYSRKESGILSSPIPLETGGVFLKLIQISLTTIVNGGI